MEGTRETDSPLEGTGFEPSVPRQEKWSMPSSSDQTRVGRTLTLGGGAESSLEGRDIELSVSPKDIRTSPYDLCANRSDRRQSREGDRWFESTSLHQGVMNKSSQAANLPQAANRPTLTGGGLTVRIPFPPAASPVRTAIEPLAQYHRDHRRHRIQNRGAIATPRRDVAGGGEAGVE